VDRLVSKRMVNEEKIQVMTKDQAQEVKTLSELYWLDESHPRTFSFFAYSGEIPDIVRAAELIRAHKAGNLRVEFTNFQQAGTNTISIGDTAFELGLWPYRFTESLVKDLIELLGNLYFNIEVEGTDGVGYELDKNLEIVGCWLLEDGGG